MRLSVIVVLAAAAFPALPQTTQNPPQVTASWFISGRVMMDDGGAPPQPVTVENVCDGLASLIAFTDSRGYFSFRIGASGGRVMQDASVSRTDPSIAMSNSPAGGTANANAAAQDSTQQSGMMEPQRNIGGYVSRASTEHAVDACELHASLAGYWTDPLSLRNRRPLDTGPVGTIILHRIGKVEEGTVSVTTLAAPKDARTAYEKGWQAMGGGKLDEARRQLEKAVRLYPGFALAWARLGQLEAKLNRAEDAGRSFENAIRADPKYVQSYLGLAAVQLSQRQWEKLTSTTAQALRLDPVNYPQAYYMDAVGNYYARRLEAAEKSARQAQDLDRQHRWPQVSRILGLILASRREYRSAAIEFSKYLEMAPQAADAEEVRKLLARAEELGADTGKQ